MVDKSRRHISDLQAADETRLARLPHLPRFRPSSSRAWTSPPGTITSAQSRPPASPASPAAPPGLTPPPATRTTSQRRVHQHQRRAGRPPRARRRARRAARGTRPPRISVKRRDNDADADAISLNSLLGSRGRRRTPKHMALWGLMF
jgi:hypothetical protein